MTTQSELSKMESARGIPPPEVRTRLLNMISRRALYSNNRDHNSFNHVDSATIYDDQYWYIQPGKGKHQGLYLIVSAYTGRALWVNHREDGNAADGETGTYDPPGAYDDHYFDLAQTQGTGIRNKQFRLHTPAGHGNLYSRLHMSPELGCLSDKSQIYDDQWFTFEMEPLRFVRIEYDQEHPEIITTGLRHFPPQEATNHGDTEPTSQEMTISEETEQQSTFTAELGLSITASTEFSCGVPLLAEGKVSISATVSTNFAWGTTNITRQKWEAKVTLKCPPKSSLRCTATLQETRLRMPFVSYWKPEKGGKEIQLKGIYEGQSCAKLKTVTSPLQYIPE